MKIRIREVRRQWAEVLVPRKGYDAMLTDYDGNMFGEIVAENKSGYWINIDRRGLNSLVAAAAASARIADTKAEVKKYGDLADSCIEALNVWEDQFPLNRPQAHVRLLPPEEEADGEPEPEG